METKIYTNLRGRQTAFTLMGEYGRVDTCSRSLKETIMKKALIVSLALASGLSITTLPVLAEGGAHPAHTQGKHREYNVNHRQHHQADRIRHGVKSGELTRAEAKELNQQRREIRQQERAYRADGSLTQAERRDLHHDMNALSKNIYNEKHDAEKRPGAH